MPGASPQTNLTKHSNNKLMPIINHDYTDPEGNTKQNKANSIRGPVSPQSPFSVSGGLMW